MKLISLAVKALVRVYQYGISPILPGTCRYTPTCSAYAIEAIDRFGPFKGTWLGFRRILRCHPWGGSGFDPVPDKSSQACACGKNDQKHEMRAL